ncbi:DUF2062 domain-containing protein [Rubritalea sp.]|uniref:DUF2062 domain-containing protein n=1 Tax=Rubritalea sp. TaxID=2109375 RepID=UPI003EFA1A2A
MKRNYLRMVRRTYRYLRHPRIRKIKWLTPFTKAIFNRRYWKPCRSTVANGLSIGLFCAMLLIPFQMVIAALGCLRGRGNVPVALAACWITNPITQPPMAVLQYKLGNWMHQGLGIPRPPIIGNWEIIKEHSDIEIFGHILLEAGTTTINISDFVIGMLSSGIALGLIAYPLVWIVSMFLPNRGKAEDPWDPTI